MPQKPDLTWKDGKTPEATAFGDIYYSPEDGVAETSHVFLGGIGAPDIWEGKDLFVIGETGFGTGLNFLVTWDLFERTAAPGARLHFVSVEGFPLEPEDLARALEAFPSLKDKAAELVGVYPPRQHGFHRRSLAGGRVTLTLLYATSQRYCRAAISRLTPGSSTGLPRAVTRQCGLKRSLKPLRDIQPWRRGLPLSPLPGQCAGVWKRKASA